MSVRSLFPPLRALLGKSNAWLVDVGASLGIHPRWKIFDELLHVVGFEPNAEEFRKLPASPRHRWVQAAVAGRRGLRTLYLTRRFNNASLLRPNAAFLAELEWRDDFDVVAEEKLECVSLDEALTEIGVQPDFLKLDTQGSEFEILQGAERGLRSDVVFIEVETEFCQLYESQPLFADIDSHLRARGFYLHDMANHLFVKPRGMHGVGGPKGRLIQADCLYFKEPRELTTATDAKIAALIMSYAAYGFPEGAIHALDVIERTGRAVPESAALRRGLHGLRHISRWLDWLPGRDFLTRLAKRFHLDFRAVGHALWENELGNRLR